MSTEFGYLQHGAGTAGPFRTERVPVKHEAPDRYFVRFEGRWRAVRVQMRRLSIAYRGERITVIIDGV